jgi:hypothetical protein
MAFNLDQFRANLPFGGARSALFEMTIQWPTGIGPQAGGASIAGAVNVGGITVTAGVGLGGGQGTDVTRFLCKVSEIPASTVGSIDVPYFGRKLKYPGDRTFAPLSITIINDESFSVRASLEKWMERIALHQSAGGRSVGSITPSTNQYVSNLTLTQYSRTGAALRAYQFVGAWPSELGSIGVDWNNADAIEEYTCQWQYQWWEAIGGNRDNGNTQTSTVGFETLG